MTYTRAKADWANSDVPDGDDFDHIEEGIVDALDGAGGGSYAPSAVLVVGGEGLQCKEIVGVYEMPNADTTVTPAADRAFVRIKSSVAADRDLDLANSAAGNRVFVYCDSDFAHTVTVAKFGGDLITIGNGLDDEATWAECVVDADGWRVLRRSPPRVRTQTLTGSGNWTVPPTVTRVHLQFCGGGGGGGAAKDGTSNVDQSPRGGGGGEAAPMNEEWYITTPGASIAYAAGAGGPGGTLVLGTASNGTNGDPSTFGSSSAPGGRGGRVYSGFTDVDAVAAGGTAAQSDSVTALGVMSRVPGAGIGQGGNGGVCRSSDIKNGRPGGRAVRNYAGGNGGTGGGNSGSYFGGGGGGGGGGGPFGVGGNGGNGGDGNNAGNATHGVAGQAAAAGSGAGGGGAGAGGCGSGTPGYGNGAAGGDGGSGVIFLTWWA